jgi:hypothetical protein
VKALAKPERRKLSPRDCLVITKIDQFRRRSSRKRSSSPSFALGAGGTSTEKAFKDESSVVYIIDCEEEKKSAKSVRRELLCAA